MRGLIERLYRAVDPVTNSIYRATVYNTVPVAVAIEPSQRM